MLGFVVGVQVRSKGLGEQVLGRGMMPSVVGLALKS